MYSAYKLNKQGDNLGNANIIWYCPSLGLDWNETDPFLMLCVKYFSWEIYMQVKKQQLELDMEHQTGSK